MSNLNIDVIRNGRDRFLGLSILSIVLYHYKLIYCGEIGVDFFVFLSGFGLAYGYSNKSFTIYEYLKKRVERIIPAYWAILFAYVSYSLLFTQREYDFMQIVLNMTCLQMYFVGFESIIPHVWYLTLILTLYLIFPIFIHLIKRHFITSMFVAIYAFIAFEYFTVNYFPIAVFRIPSFIFGMWMGYLYLCKDPLWEKIVNLRILWNVVAICMFLFFVALPYMAPESLLWNPGKYWTVIAAFSPIFTIAILIFLGWIIQPYTKMLAIIGKCSYEMFLAHQLIYDFLFGKLMGIQILQESRLFVISIILIVVFIFSYLMHAGIVKGLSFYNDLKLNNYLGNDNAS